MVLASSASANVHVAAEHEQISSDLANISLRLETALVESDVDIAEELHLLELRALRVLQITANSDYADYSTEAAAMANARALVSRIMRLEERVQAHTLDVLNQRLPGEPGRQLVSMRGRDHYAPLFRFGTPDPNRPAITPREGLAQMDRQFLQQGGRIGDFQTLDPISIAGIQSGDLFEWTQAEGGGPVQIGRSGVKHPVLARGATVAGAGSLKIIRDAANEICLVIVSNSSGNYKPGPGSVEGIVRRFGELGIDSSRILVTSLVPAEPTLVKLLMKAYNTPSLAVEARMQRIQSHSVNLRGASVGHGIEQDRRGLSRRIQLSSDGRIIPAHAMPTSREAREFVERHRHLVIPSVTWAEHRSSYGHFDVYRELVPRQSLPSRLAGRVGMTIR